MTEVDVVAAVGYVGETFDASGSRLEPDVAYKLDNKSNFIKS